MTEFEISEGGFQRQTPDGKHTVSVQPRIDPANAITDRYMVLLSDNQEEFQMELDEKGSWKCSNLPRGVDPELISWIGDEIQRYYK